MKRWSQQIRPLLRLGFPRSFLPPLLPSSCFLFKVLGARGKSFPPDRIVSPYSHRKPCILRFLLSLLLGWKLMEILLWFVCNVPPSSALPPFCPSSMGPRWSPCSSKSALPANSPCWTPPLGSQSGAPSVRTGFLLLHPIPHLSRLLFPCMSPGSLEVRTCGKLWEWEGEWADPLSVGSRRKKREKG